jgi:hypothetical protein
LTLDSLFVQGHEWRNERTRKITFPNKKHTIRIASCIYNQNGALQFSAAAKAAGTVLKITMIIIMELRSKPRGEKVFVEDLSEERRAPWREPIRGEVLRGESLSEERRAPWRESLRGEKVFVERTSPKREERRGESLQRKRTRQNNARLVSSPVFGTYR